MDLSVIVGLELLFVCFNFIALFMDKVTILKFDVLNFIAQLYFDWLSLFQMAWLKYSHCTYNRRSHIKVAYYSFDGL